MIKIGQDDKTNRHKYINYYMFGGSIMRERLRVSTVNIKTGQGDRHTGRQTFIPSAADMIDHLDCLYWFADPAIAVGHSFNPITVS